MNFTYENQFQIEIVTGSGVWDKGNCRADVQTPNDVRRLIEAFEFVSGMNSEQYRITMQGIWSRRIWRIDKGGNRLEKDLEINTIGRSGFHLVGITSKFLLGRFTDEPQNVYKVAVEEGQSTYRLLGLHTLVINRVDFMEHLDTILFQYK